MGYDGATWDTRMTNRAPMSVEVSLSFAPVHDLPLGLDYRGHMIAPTHNVGGAYSDVYGQLGNIAEAGMTPEGEALEEISNKYYQPPSPKDATS